MSNEIETARKLQFLRNPLLMDFVATALQDLQLSEADQACEDEREPHDSGTVYELNEQTFAKLMAICDRFLSDMPASIDAALKLQPQGDGYEYARNPMTLERIGSTLWLAVTGSGVTFTDDGCAICLAAMAEWASANHIEGLQFGDNGEIYSIS